MNLHWKLWVVDYAGNKINHYAYDEENCDVDGSYLKFLQNWPRDEKGI